MMTGMNFLTGIKWHDAAKWKLSSLQLAVLKTDLQVLHIHTANVGELIK